MPFYLMTLMLVYDNWSPGMWIYFAMHSSYGLLWILKSCTFPDKSFEGKVSITCAVKAWILVLGPYSLAGFKVAARANPESQSPHPERVACALLLYFFGLLLLLATPLKLIPDKRLV
jgi:hypothetical protein